MKRKLSMFCNFFVNIRNWRTNCQYPELLKKNADLVNENSVLTDKVAELEKMMVTIAHDLKGPISGSLNWLELIDSKYDDLPEEKRKNYLKAGLGQLKPAHGLLINLLEWSRFGRHALKPVKMSLREVGDINFDLLGPEAKKKGLELINLVPDDLIIEADQNIIHMALRNIISNSIKFTKTGSITLSATTSGGVTRVSVADTGIGISPENLKRIFSTEFHSTPGTNNETGTGFGLLFCKEMIEKSGGQLFIESSSLGTTVSFSV